MNIFNLLNFIAGLAFFLYGIHAMGNGLRMTSGGKLEGILGSITSNKVMAVLTGALVTAVMQSSSATTVMIVGFVNSGLMELANSVHLIMGANIGATITPWIMSLSSVGGSGTSVFLQLLKPTSFSAILAIVGVFILLISKDNKKKNIAQILVGFAILMFGMSTMSDAVEPLADSEKFGEIMLMFSNPILGTLVGTLLTAMIQSSSATVGMVQVLSTSGLITYGTAIPLMLGANIGTCATALLSSIGSSRNAVRSALVHLFYNISRGIIFLVVFYTLNSFLHFSILDANATAVGIAFFYTCLSIASAIVLFPFDKVLLKLVYLAVPVKDSEKSSDEDEKNAAPTVKMLDERFLSSPGLAIDQCMAAAVAMANDTRAALLESLDIVGNYNEKKAKDISRLENNVDIYEDELGSYLVKLSTHDLSDEQSYKVSLILHSIGDFERISDHACNIMGSAKEMQEKDLKFSKRASEEVAIFTDAIRDTLNMTFDSFINGDKRLASNVQPMEEVIDELTMKIKNRHIKRLRKGKCSIEMGFVLSDLLTNYERVSDHCSNIAISLLQKPDGVGAHEFELEMVSQDNEEYNRLVKVYEEKYKLPKKTDLD